MKTWRTLLLVVPVASGLGCSSMQALRDCKHEMTGKLCNLFRRSDNGCSPCGPTGTTMPMGTTVPMAPVVAPYEGEYYEGTMPPAPPILNLPQRQDCSQRPDCGQRPEGHVMPPPGYLPPQGHVMPPPLEEPNPIAKPKPYAPGEKK